MVMGSPSRTGPVQPPELGTLYAKIVALALGCRSDSRVHPHRVDAFAPPPQHVAQPRLQSTRLQSTRVDGPSHLHLDAFAKRHVAACDGEVTLGRLLYGGGPTWMTGLADVSVFVGTTPTTVKLKCFPRAAEKRGERWRVVHCPVMPAAETAPWRSTLADPFNTVIDSMICLRASVCAPLQVVLGLQNKEYVNAAHAIDRVFGDDARAKRHQQMTYRGSVIEVKKFLQNRHLVHICVTPNAVPVDGLLHRCRAQPARGGADARGRRPMVPDGGALGVRCPRRAVFFVRP